MRVKKARAIFRKVLLLLAALLPLCAVAEDSQYRFGLNLRLLDTEYVDLALYGEFRENDDPAVLRSGVIAPRLTFDFWKSLPLGLNYTLIETDNHRPPPVGDLWQSQQRLELEANPHWQLTDSLSLRTRNRLEFRWISGRPDMNTRSRHRLELAQRIEKAKPLQSVFANYEFFYDLEKMRNSEHRLVPLGLEFKLAGPVSLKTYYLWQHAETRTSWLTTHNFYTVFDVSFK